MLNKLCNQMKLEQIRQWGLNSIHTCRSYFTRYITTVCVARALADSSNFELLGEQSSQKWEIPCLGRQRTAVQSLTPLALSSGEKSVIVQIHKKHTHTHTNK